MQASLAIAKNVRASLAKRAHTTVFLEPSDEPFDGVAPGIERLLDHRRASTAATALA